MFPKVESGANNFEGELYPEFGLYLSQKRATSWTFVPRYDPRAFDGFNASGSDSKQGNDSLKPSPRSREEARWDGASCSLRLARETSLRPNGAHFHRKCERLRAFSILTLRPPHSFVRVSRLFNSSFSAFSWSETRSRMGGKETADEEKDTRGEEKEGYNTRTSQGVTHPSTTLAQARLTSEF